MNFSPAQAIVSQKNMTTGPDQVVELSQLNIGVQPNSSVHVQSAVPRRTWWFSAQTMVGFLAVLIWSSSPLVNTLLARIPVFEILSFSLWLSGLIGIVRLTVSRRWHQVFAQPWYVWVLGFVGIYSNEITYVASLKYAPAAHINVINWLWPIMTLLLSTVVLRERTNSRAKIAALMAFLGVCAMIWEGQQLKDFHPYYMIGYGLALVSAIIWSSFTVLSRRFKNAPHEMVHLYCGLASLCSVVIHWRFETYVAPLPAEFFYLFIMGFAISGIAYYFWDFGIKKGSLHQLTILSYLGPIFSLILLLLFGRAHLTLELVIASSLVLSAALMVRNRSSLTS